MERESEVGQLASLLEAAGAGHGAVAAIEGPPGIGKTRLLQWARQAADEKRLTTLAARGGDLERDLPFGVVRQLFELSLRRAGPSLRGELLDGPARLAGALLLDDRPPAPGQPSDRTYALLRGLYWLTSNLAERAPLLIAVDDAHWSDGPSLRFLDYLARRIEDLPILLAVTLRPSDPESRGEFTARLRTDGRTTVLRPAGLSPEAVVRVVRSKLGADAASEFCAACHTATDGIPFLVGELVDELEADGIPPTAREAGSVSRLVPAAVARQVLARLARMSPGARELARAVALLGADVELHLAARLAGLDREAGAAATDELARAELLRAGAPLEFSHPLIREAIYADMPPGERALLHARAARALTELPGSGDRVAAQLLATEPLGEAWAVDALRAASAAALARGGPESAAAYLRRALQEPLDDEARADVVFELAGAETLVEGPAATTRLGEALELAEESDRRAVIAAQLSRRLFFDGRPRDAVVVCERGLAELGDRHPELSARLEAELLLHTMFEPSMLETTSRLTAGALQSGRGESFGSKALLAMAAWVGALANVSTKVVTPSARRALAGDQLMEEDNGGPAFVCGALVLALADPELALQTCRKGLKAAQATGNEYAFATNKTFSSRVRLLSGDVADAVADGTEGLDACEANDIAIGPAYACAFLAEALMERGDLDAAQRALDRANPSEELPDNAHWHPFLDSRARLLALKGELSGALDATLDCGRRYERNGGRNPGWVAWRSRAALCLSQLDDDRRRARELAEEEVELAGAFGAPRALGRALRIFGLVVGGKAGVSSLRDAVEVLEPSTARLEHGYALCGLGAALRRLGEREASRDPLRRAVAMAHAGGALALEDRAHQELLATGARPRRIPVTGVEALTPAERRVAGMAAEGLTNREIAQTLFVSLKTVEMHLSRTYRKLDLTSRSELPGALTGVKSARREKAGQTPG